MSTIICHIITDLFVNTNSKTFIFKIDISDHSICFLQPTSRQKKNNKATYITKGVINNSRIEIFKQDLYQTSWDDVINNKSMNGAYNYQYARLLLTYLSIFQNKI